MFNPAQLLKMMGISPEEMTARVAVFENNLRQTVMHFDAKLTEVLASNARIEAKLDMLLGETDVIAAIQHEGADNGR